MTGETSITVIGNLTNDPELRFTPSGSAVANFTIASTPRTFDRQANEWKDGETLFLRASVWREAAEHVAESLTKGTRVIVSGLLKSRSYETKEGEKRTVIELEVEEIGPSLRYAMATVTRSQGTRPAQPDTPVKGWRDRVKEQADTAAADNGSGYADDDPWFGKNATTAVQPGGGSGRGPEPSF
ncbi:single-stranded DNA-binding protein [Pseudarthrobacter sp. NPDC058329]|uniref:single-stranded DNA-binding protein n=1 Tax=Pseudarthrobacter sp. NPDC058329 TaxID=3346448 RepID=UPI0036DF417B